MYAPSNRATKWSSKPSKHPSAWLNASRMRERRATIGTDSRCMGEKIYQVGKNTYVCTIIYITAYLVDTFSGLCSFYPFSVCFCGAKIKRVRVSGVSWNKLSWHHQQSWRELLTDLTRVERRKESLPSMPMRRARKHNSKKRKGGEIQIPRILREIKPWIATITAHNKNAVLLVQTRFRN